MILRLLPLLILSACTAASTLPPAPQSATSIEATQRSTQTIAIRIGEITGIPQNLADDLKDELDGAAKVQGIEIVKDERQSSSYTLQAEMSAVALDNQTLVSHRWTVLDAAGNKTHSFSLSDTQEGGKTFAWSGVRNETLKSMAQTAITRFSSWVRSNKL